MYADDAGQRSRVKSCHYTKGPVTGPFFWA
jgi:hypothetical protein